MFGGLVNRLDVSELGKPTRTPQGFLRVPAFPTRAGVFEYRKHDGTIVRELRPPEEVFKTDSLATLSSAPLTERHPSEMVSPKNVRALSVGHIGEDVRRDGDKVSTFATVQHEDTIGKVDRRELVELSSGYQCEIDPTPGVYEGQRYDQVQRNIRYNHVALLPRGAGRAGGDVALRLDSGDAMLAAPFSETVQQRQDSGDHMDPKDLTTIRLDGFEITVPKQWAQVVEKAMKDRDEKITKLTGERDGAQGRLDAAGKELEGLKTKLAEATDVKRVDSLVTERVALLESARRVLPAEHKFDGQTTRQVHEAVLIKLDDKLDLKGKSDEYVTARFDAAIAALPEDKKGAPVGGNRTDSLDAARRAATQHTGAPVQREDAKPYVPDWQRPTSLTKQ